MTLAARNATADADAEAMPAFADLGWQEEDRDDSWLVTYADIVSTALAMVVLLFGRTALAPVAPEPTPVALATAVVANAPTPDAFAPPSPDLSAQASPDSSAPPPEDAAALDAVSASAVAAAADPADTVAALDVDESADSLHVAEPPPGEQLAALVASRFAGRISAAQRSQGLVLTIPAVALFDSARADLNTVALPLLNELAATLRAVGAVRISVEGHTDDRPVQGGAFRSNWDLAATRANAVTQFFLAQGFAPQRLNSVSYADTRPVADNGSVEGRAANRRVELAIDFDTPRG